MGIPNGVWLRVDLIDGCGPILGRIRYHSSLSGIPSPLLNPQITQHPLVPFLLPIPPSPTLFILFLIGGLLFGK